MLETDNIDDDYFTPASSTSLANIFGKCRKEDGTENESLKYSPPKAGKPEETKVTNCVFACALLGYEWSNGAYAPRGKLGFAILKIMKTGQHNIVLYDSNKTTLSCATIAPNFEVTVKENVYCLYHDNFGKYWCLHMTENEINKIKDLLKTFDVIIKNSTDEDTGLPTTSNNLASVGNIDHENREGASDTDSSINRRTKKSLLNRMANMGQSVLPTRAISTERTSDSSDTNDTNNYKIVRHKSTKSSMKRNSPEINMPKCQSLVESDQKLMSCTQHSSNSVPFFTYVNGQLVPVTNTKIVTSPSSGSGNDTNYFMSEQRISNSELRINMNRLTDKVDQVLFKLGDKESKDNHSKSNIFQMEIFQKLLAEYEGKITMYEKIIKEKDLENKLVTQPSPLVNDTLLTTTQNTPEYLKIQNLEEKIYEYKSKVALLSSENEILLDKCNNATKSELILKNEMEMLKQELHLKQAKKFEELCQNNDKDNDITNKIKTLMNDTFHALSVNFENTKDYSGEKVKAITAAVIKKVTIESLNNV